MLYLIYFIILNTNTKNDYGNPKTIYSLNQIFNYLLLFSTA